MGFSPFNLDPRVMSGVTAARYQTPTPIQQEAIPLVMQGRDVMGLAQTGTGKTAAFALPILHKLLNGPRGRVRALVVAPTRELAQQIHDAFTALGRQCGLRTAVVYGGVGYGPQVQKLRAGVEILVACPGRLLDHLEQGTCRLDGVEILVLDEADHMFDMGFLPNIRKIVKRLPAQRQTLLFSATMPDDIRTLAHEVLRNPATVQVGGAKPAETVAHAMYPVPQHLKSALLLELLKHTDTGSVLIFTRTKHRARRVGDTLQKAGFKAISLQGNLSQNRRQEAMDGFRSGKYQVMVATDIAARGIDVASVSHVINFDIPDTVEAYTHRIGRTGRAARSGDAFTLVTDEDRDMIRAIERVLKMTIERRRMDGFDYAVPPQEKHKAEFSRPPLPPRGPRRTHPQPAHLDRPHPHGREFPSAGGNPPRHGHGAPRPHGQASSMHPRPHGYGPSRPQRPHSGGQGHGGGQGGNRGYGHGGHGYGGGPRRHSED